MVSIFQYPLTSGIHRTVFIVITGTFFRFLFSFLFLAHRLEVFFFILILVYVCIHAWRSEVDPLVLVLICEIEVLYLDLGAENELLAPSIPL